MASNMKSYDYLFKMLLIGDPGTGKTEFLFQLTESSNDGNEAFVSTIGIDFKTRTDEIHGKKIKSHIWDTAGQERYQVITSSYYRRAEGVFIFFNVNIRRTFDNVKNWLNNIRTHTKDNVSILIVANEHEDGERQVSPDEIRHMAAGIPHMEISTLRKRNVDRAFMKMIHMIYQKKH